MRKIILLISIILFQGYDLYATHNRAGEIRYEQLNELTIRLEVITYTKASSVAADRDSIDISWGDGTMTSIDRTNGNGFLLPNDIQMNIYTMIHTYPGRGDYTISMLDPNRIENIQNVDFPNSVNIPFYIQTTIKLFNSNFQGLNRSPQLTNPPIDFACLNQTFIHNPGAVDLDDDSLAYELIVPLMDEGMPVPNYLLPSQIIAGLNNTINFDNRTGTFVWITPQKAGEYNIAILIKEYRKGQLISSTVRDMQILVRADCDKNSPPLIMGRRDTCIIAGQTLNTEFIIDDLNRGNRGGKVRVQAFGTPFQIPPIPVTMGGQNFEITPFTFKLNWNTSCIHIRKDAYNIILKATDNYFDTSGLTSTLIYKVKIVGPPPLNLSSSSNLNDINLEWDAPYFCDDGTNNFRGFSVWRKELPGIINDSCDPGLEKYGYKIIEYLSLQKNNNKYFYSDTTAQANKNYCYRVQAEFAFITPSGFLYNFTPSLPSNETCNSLKTDKPFILNVDVKQTDSQNGIINIKYQKPLTPDFDTIQIPAPYEVKVIHAPGRSNFNELSTFTRTFTSYSGINDTFFTHSRINTSDSTHNYYILLKSIPNSNSVQSLTAQSIFLNASNSNKSIKLNWTNQVPWINTSFTILKKNQGAASYDSIATTGNTQYTDRNIIFDSSYCYLIKSTGEYSNPRIERPLINYSNEICITAIDSTPPCCPRLKILGPCELNDSNYIVLQWEYREDSCSSNGVTKFSILEINGDVISFLEDSLPKDIREFRINNAKNLNSCYSVKAFNIKGVSCISDQKCISLCPEFELPNTFTPNGDGSNDLFKPIKFRQITNIKFKVINQWGNQVFESDGPVLSWDGKNKNGSLCNDGTYYYICEYTSQRETKTLNGFIELVGGK